MESIITALIVIVALLSYSMGHKAASEQLDGHTELLYVECPEGQILDSIVRTDHGLHRTCK